MQGVDGGIDAAPGGLALRGDEQKAGRSNDGESESGAAIQEPINIGSRRELFVDRYLVERLDGARLELHRPTRREVVFRTDAPWEGNGSAYQSVFRDGDRFRMY